MQQTSSIIIYQMLTVKSLLESRTALNLSQWSSCQNNAGTFLSPSINFLALEVFDANAVGQRWCLLGPGKRETLISTSVVGKCVEVMVKVDC